MRMTTSEVFRPSDGDLLIRDNIARGMGSQQDMFRPRPVTQSGYRFGQLSHNSFFTRHNPHPHRVRHFKGLLDVPICSVNDDGYFASPRYSLQFPPNSFNNSKLQQWRGRIPVNAINVNSQLHPINTITGLQYFNGLNSYPWRERAIPKLGLVPVTEAWRDELKRFADQLNDTNLTKDPAKDSLPKHEEDRPKTTLYSQETGRLIPPPSRAMSRANSRRGNRSFVGPGGVGGAATNGFVGGNLQHISAAPDVENVVLTMLCQILQTEDVNAVQAWLCSAGDTEKTMVMDLIRAAMVGREEYWKQYPAEVLQQPPEHKTSLPPINGVQRQSSGEFNRLVLDTEPDIVPPANPFPIKPDPAKSTLRTVVEDNEYTVQQPTNDAFRPPSPKKPQSQQAPRPPTGQAPSRKEEEAPRNAGPEAKLRYTKSPPAPLDVWNQNDSLNTF